MTIAQPNGVLYPGAAILNRGVQCQLRPRDGEETAGGDPVAGEVTVRRLRVAVARLAGIAYEHAAPGAAQHQRGAQPRRSTPGDQTVPREWLHGVLTQEGRTAAGSGISPDSITCLKRRRSSSTC